MGKNSDKQEETVACPDCAGLGATNGQIDYSRCNGTGRIPQ